MGIFKDFIDTRVGKYIDDKISQKGKVNISRFHSSILDWNNYTPASTNQQLASYEGWVYACVNKIARTGAKVEIDLYKKTSSGVDEVQDHPAIALLERSNDFMNRYDLIELILMFWQLTGEAYVYKIRNEFGDVIGLYPWLSPSNMRIVPGTGDNFIDGYVYVVPGSGEELPFEAKDIIYFRHPDPTNVYQGKSPISAADIDIQTEREAKTYNYNFFKNSAIPAGILKTDQELTQDVFDRVIKQFESRHKGSNNSYKLKLLEQGLEYTDVGLTHKDMDFLEQRKFSRDSILSIFGVPKSVLGIVEDVNRANADTSKRVFLEETIDPLMTKLVGTLNEQLLAIDFEDDVFFDFEDLTPEDQSIRLDRYQRGLEDGWMTINEVRESEELPPVEGGDVILIALNKAPLQDIINTQDQPEQDPKQQNDKPTNQDTPSKQKKLHFVKKTKTQKQEIEDITKRVLSNVLNGNTEGQ